MAAQRWLLVADGARARIYEQLRAGALLRQVASFELSLEDDMTPSDRQSRTHDRMGPSRHAIETQAAPPRQRAESHFNRRVAQYVRDQRAAGKFDALIVFAAPRALGELRDTLGELITFDRAVDVVDEEPQQLHARMVDAGYR